MSFFEDIAAALDTEGLESRVNDDVMFIPITAELELQFVEIDPILPAANVYIAAADVDEDDEDFEAVLVSVVFSAEDAVKTVARHVATDQVVTVLRDLLEGTDERIADLEFFQDADNSNLVRAAVAGTSEIQVLVESIDSVPSAIVQFAVYGDDQNELLDQAIDELWESDADATLSDEDRQMLFAGLQPEETAEVLDLGVFKDFDKLFDVLSLAADQAENWEDQLDPFDEDEFEEPDVYDIFGEDDGDFDGEGFLVDDSVDGLDEDRDEDFDDEDFDEDDDEGVNDGNDSRG